MDVITAFEIVIEYLKKNYNDLIIIDLEHYLKIIQSINK
jgi:hypothetical protein